MAKAKKSAPKKTSKRREAIAKPIRRKMAKRTSAKKVKAESGPVARRPLKSIAKKKRASNIVARKPLRKTPRQALVQDTIIDIIDEPVPGVVRVTEYEMVQTPNSEPAPDADNSESPKQ
jgi:hypothetical protein